MKISKSLTGIILIIVTLLGIVAWELWGREELLYDEVLVFSANVEANDVIRADMLAVKKINNANDKALKAEDAQKVVGKAATQYIPRNTEIFDVYFDESNLVVGEDEYVLSIPNDWLQSYPQTLRRGDTAYFYADGKMITKATVAYAKDGANQEVTSRDEERLAGSSTISLVEVIVTNAQADMLSKLAERNTKFVILYN